MLSVVLLSAAAPPEPAEIDRLILQLGSARFAQREAAAKALDRIGEPAWGRLRLALASPDAEIRRRAAGVLDTIGRRLFVEVRRFDGHTDAVHSVALSPDGSRVLSGGEDRLVRVWDFATGKQVESLPGADSIYCVAFSPDGKQAVSSNIGFATLWDLRTAKEVRRFDGAETWMENAAFRPGHPQIVTVGRYATLILWDGPTGKQVRSYSAPTQMALRLAVSADGKHLLSASGFKPASFDPPRLWDLESGKELQQLKGHTGPVRGLAFAPGGRRAVTCSTDGTVRLWDLSNGKETACLRGHEGSVSSVSFSPDGKRLASGGFDRTVRLWDVESGQELHRFEGHEGPVTSVAYSPDSRFVLSGSADKSLRLWRLPSPDPR